MTDEPRFLPASSFALDALADILTRSFEEYFYTSNTSAEDLARRIRMENIDLCRSVVMLVGDQPAGMALMALRAYRGWCDGFGLDQLVSGVCAAASRAWLERGPHRLN